MKSDAEQKAAERAAWRARGYVPVQTWVHKLDRARFNAFVRKMNKARAAASIGESKS